MTYLLSEGLTALGAYGILIIANNNIYDYMKETGLNKDKTASTAYLLFPVLGIAYLAGSIGHIIMNSEVILFKNIGFFIEFSLIITIIIIHFKLFNDIISNHIKKEKSYNLFAGVVSALWTYMFFSFMNSPDEIKATVMTLILLLPLIFPIHSFMKFLKIIILNRVRPLILDR